MRLMRWQRSLSCPYSDHAFFQLLRARVVLACFLAGTFTQAQRGPKYAPVFTLGVPGCEHQWLAIPTAVTSVALQDSSTMASFQKKLSRSKQTPSLTSHLRVFMQSAIGVSNRSSLALILVPSLIFGSDLFFTFLWNLFFIAFISLGLSVSQLTCLSVCLSVCLSLSLHRSPPNFFPTLWHVKLSFRVVGSVWASMLDLSGIEVGSLLLPMCNVLSRKNKELGLRAQKLPLGKAEPLWEQELCWLESARLFFSVCVVVEEELCWLESALFFSFVCAVVEASWTLGM